MLLYVDPLNEISNNNDDEEINNYVLISSMFLKFFENKIKKINVVIILSFLKT